MLKFTISMFVAALFTLAGCTAPDWLSAQASEVRLRNGIPGQQGAVVSDFDQIEFVLSAFRRSSKVNPTEAERQRLWAAMCFDVIGDRPVAGRWLYEPTTGMFSHMDPMIQPVFRMTDEDRIRVNGLIPKKG